MSAAEPNPYILVVEDNTLVATLLQQVLQGEGYEVAVVGDGLDALDRVARRRPDLIFLDLDLPGLNGYEVCRRLKGDRATRLVPVVIVTAQSELQNKVDAWDHGADDFLTKPFQLIEVTTRCRSLLRVKRLVEERDSAEAVVFALARAVEAKSPYTHGHSGRVQRYALGLADAAGVSADGRRLLEKGALLHDIGKISIPDALLDKPGPLTAAEYDLVKDHARQGAHIVQPLRSLYDVVPLIRWHHERLDGTGYPDGLSGDGIPRLVRILSVADVYDSLASVRPYRAALPHELCLEMLRDNALGGGLDPELVATFAPIARDLRPGLPTPDEPLAAVLSPSQHPDALARTADGGLTSRV